MVAAAPGWMSLVSKALPLSAVAVCAVVSLFFTVTFDPALTVRVAGANLKLLMSIVCPPPAATDAPDELGAAVELPPPPPLPPQPATATAAAATATSERLDWSRVIGIPSSGLPSVPRIARRPIGRAD